MFINFNDFVNENLNSEQFDKATYKSAFNSTNLIVKKYFAKIDGYGVEYVSIKEYSLSKLYETILETIRPEKISEFKNNYVNMPTIEQVALDCDITEKTVEIEVELGLFGIDNKNIKKISTLIDVDDNFKFLSTIISEIATQYNFTNMKNSIEKIVNSSPSVLKVKTYDEENQEYNSKVYPISNFQKHGEGTKQDPIRLKLDDYSADHHDQSFFFFLNSVIAARKNQKYVVMIDKYSEDASTIFNNYTNVKYPKFELGRSNTTYLHSISALKNTPILTDDLNLLIDDTIWQIENSLKSKFKINLQDYLDILAAPSRPVFLFERLYGRYNDFSNFEFPKWMKKIENQFKFVIVK